MTKLNISDDLQLPLEVAGEAIGILATRGAGKSYTSATLVEELYAAKIQVAVIDPTGVYWGLRAGATAHGKGLPIIVLGGAHGDAPLESTAGALIADVLVDTGQSLILDFSDFGTKGEQTRFVTAFAERLYARKARARTTLHLIIDEADEFAPQRPMKDEPRMLGAMERLVRRGRSRGIGVTLITQRSAALNKNVLDVVDTLLAMRMPGPRDRAAVASWITAKSESDEIGLLDSLPGLSTGTAWAWSPVRGLLQKVPMRRIRTFDSYATPKPGQAKAEPKALLEIDIAKLGQQIEATKERAKADDPRELKKQKAELERKITQLEKQKASPAANPQEIQGLNARLKQIARGLEDAMKFIVDITTRNFDAAVPKEEIESAISAAVARGLQTIESKMNERGRDFERLRREAERLLSRLKGLTDGDVNVHVEVKHNEPHTVAVSERTATPQPRLTRMASTNGSLPLGEQKVLTVCAQYPDGATREQITILSGYKRSTRDAYIQRLREKGYVDGGAVVVATQAGIEALGSDFEPLPTGDALRLYWLARLPEGEQAILENLINVWPEATSRESLEETTGYKRSTRDAYIQRLKTRRLVEITGPGEVKASDILFE